LIPVTTLHELLNLAMTTVPEQIPGTAVPAADILVASPSDGT
jgi:hypothetical protein